MADTDARPQRLRPLTLTTPAALVAVTAVVTVVAGLTATALTGGLASISEPGLPDPGSFTRVGLPALRGIRDLAMAVAVGSLIVALTCVPAPAGSPARGRALGPARARLLGLASTCAATWAGANLMLAALVYSDASGRPWAAPGFWREAWFFTWRYPLGQYLLWGAGIALVVAIGGLLLRSTTGLGVLTVAAMIGLWPAALAGHAAGTLDHDNAVTFQAIHLVGLAVWFGGLASLVLVGRRLGPDLGATLRRWSPLAGLAALAMASSGLLAASIRLPSIGAIATPYGLLLLAKSVALVTLCSLGWWQRRRVLPRIGNEPGAFLRLATIEIVVLGTATGLGVALGRTAPPEPAGARAPLTAAQSMLGRELPAAPDLGSWFTAWDIDPFWAPVAVLAVGAYLAGAMRLRRRGDRWSALRLISWCFGWALLVWATSGSPGVYGRVLFSMHMVQHMTIATAVPTFLVLGAPVSLALRTLTRRADGSLGPRELLQRAMVSFPVQLLSHPVVAAGSFVVSMIVFYYSSAFESSLQSHTAHLLMTVHFLVSGYLFAECIVGDDPGITRPAYPLRALILMVTFGFHALFAVSLMSSTTVLASEWFNALGREWGPTPAEDQRTGAGIGWALGEYPLAVMAAALLASWVRADARERRRIDRQADRDGGRELAAYNDQLRRIAERSKPG